MLKIIHIIPSLNKGGAERLVLDICNELSKRKDIQIKLITFRSNNAYSFLSETLEWEVIPSRVIPSISGKTTVEVGQLQKTIEAFQPDVIHSNLFETEMVLSQINYPKAKYVVHFHDNMVQFENFSFDSLTSKKKLTSFYEKRIVLKTYRNRTTEFIAISKNNFEYIQRVVSKAFKTTLLPNAVDLKRFHMAKPNHEVFQLVTIGSLVSSKGHKLAIDTINELSQRKISVHLHILGEGLERGILETYISDLKLNSFITLHGNLDYPEQILQKAHVYIHTSYKEAFGLTLIEAMACNLPVVCTDGGGNRDLINEGINGFLVKERNPQELADRIEFLCSNPEIKTQMGENARKFAEEFGIEEYCDRLLNIYANA